ncbi:MAG TPA: metallophosphoesterase family protein [Vicinamibacterales bacterium]|jgi:Icc-related predicted phosphoesterase
MRFGALGDIHGDFEAARRIVARHPEVPAWLCVGDVASHAGAYESIGAPLYWIHGNNDNLDAIAAGALPTGYVYVHSGTSVDAGMRVAGLGGTFAPTWYETPAKDLPHPVKGSVRATELADKRRHFVRAQVEACQRLRDIDVFLTHEAAAPFRPYAGERGPDAGKRPINDVLSAMQPRLHLFGHHHRASDQIREGVRSIGLDLVSRSYLLIDSKSLNIDMLTL